MSIVEFATITTKPSPTSTHPSSDPAFHDVLRACLSSLTSASGTHNFRFIASSSTPETNTSEEILALLGGWNTVSAHAAYLSSGEAATLLKKLEPWIRIREVFHVDADLREVEALEPWRAGGVLTAAVFRVPAGGKTVFEGVVDGIGRVVVGGWKIRKGEQFERAEGIVRGELRQEGKAEKRGDEGGEVWVGFCADSGEAVMEELKGKVLQLGVVDEVEILRFRVLVG